VEKSSMLTGYLFFLLEEFNKNHQKLPIELITPRNENERGCQVSMLVPGDGKIVFDALLKHGVMADWREPNVIRVAPVPLYNTFEEVWHFATILKKIVEA